MPGVGNSFRLAHSFPETSAVPGAVASRWRDRTSDAACRMEDWDDKSHSSGSSLVIERAL